MNVNEKKTKSTALYIAGSIICLMLIGFFLLTDGGSTGDKPSQVSRMQELTQQVQGMESDVKKKEEQVTELVDQYQTKTGTKPPLAFDTMDLSQEERELLEQQISEEKDVSIRSLLKEILKKKEEISELREKIAAIEDLLPAPHIAKKGESHYQVALTFLVNDKGVEKERAIEMLARTALFEELAEGFKVWSFYTGEEYGTSVTQGDAVVSPNVFVHRGKKKLMDDFDKTVSERDQLAENIKSLEEKQNEVLTQLADVTKEKENLKTRLTDLDKRVNSMFYHLDSQKNLKKKGILKSSFLTATKLKNVSPEHYDQTLDLTSDDQLVILASDLGIKKIKDVVLYPRFYKKGTSYKVSITINKRRALVTFMDKSKFRSERVVIAVK
jgi:predicted  nucleic acid-binding Zn-ribbon protein